MSRFTLAASVLLALASLSGCGPSASPPPPDRNGAPADFYAPVDPIEPRPEGRMQLPPYRLNFGDELEVIYQIRHDITTDDYKLQIEDRISVRFPFQPELNQTLAIPSDGNLSFLLVDEPFRVAGLTVKDIKARLRTEYEKLIQKPQFTVVVEAANAKIAELKSMITTSPRGQSRLVPVAPDGRLSVPLIPNVMAYGLTIPELTTSLNNEYRKAGMEGIEVGVNVLNVAPIKVYVLGEVTRPGLHSLRHHATLVQSIGSAGGLIRGRADSSKVLLVRRRGFPVPQGAVLNVAYLTDGLGARAAANQPIDFAAHRFDPFIQDDDIIFVPSVQLAKNADWIRIVFTENIYRVVPFSSSAGYSVTDSANWIGGK